VIYLDKYLLFILPPLLILMGWVITRTWQIVWTRVLVLALVGLLARSLYLVYTEVHFEQWREAAMFVCAEYRSDEPIVIEPGFDFRPFAYYFNGNLPVNFHTIDTAPVLMDGDGVFSVLQPADGQRNQREDHATLVAAHRIWVVSSVDSASNVVESGESVAAVRLILDQFEPRESRVFAGPIRVRLFESGRALRR
jgi:4-amino-4-deoxy-L-arabinose transferase-like glycosyltransferase